eukprot:TRINITY_DN52922_c0_g1_i1.p1 TRINITY_DN52922_c0_g1~~TRINITY_DN52922_c0_g1_i1.p1  ORF type:complete len:229 (+),score=35.98 TRINITY_DN52922_c0_g1_i1:46-732(+)
MAPRPAGLEEAVLQLRKDRKNMTIGQIEKELSSRGFKTSTATIGRILRNSAATANSSEATSAAVGQRIQNAETGSPKRRRFAKGPENSLSDAIQSMDKFALDSSLEVAAGAHEASEQMARKPCVMHHVTPKATSHGESPKDTVPAPNMAEPIETTTPTRMRVSAEKASQATLAPVSDFKSPSSAEKSLPPVREKREGFLGALDSLESLAFSHQRKTSSAQISFEVDRI